MKKQLVTQRAWQGLMQAAPEEGVRPLKDAKEIDIDLIHGDPGQPRKYFDEVAIEELLGTMLTELRTRGLARVSYDPALQRALAEAILEHNLSGRQTLAAAQLLKRHVGLTVAEAVARVLGPKEDGPANGATAPGP